MFKQSLQGAITVLSGDDVLNEETIESATAVTQRCLNQGQPRIVINMEQIPLMDSVGLEFLLETRDQCVERGGVLKLAAPNALCKDILKITGIDEELEVFDDAVLAAGSFAL